MGPTSYQMASALPKINIKTLPFVHQDGNVSRMVNRPSWMILHVSVRVSDRFESAFPSTPSLRHDVTPRQLCQCEPASRALKALNLPATRVLSGKALCRRTVALGKPAGGQALAHQAGGQLLP